MISDAPPQVLFFFNDPATTEIYTLSLHDALPIFAQIIEKKKSGALKGTILELFSVISLQPCHRLTRSEEHTSELQSHHDLVCRLLLEKKKRTRKPQLHPSRPTRGPTKQTIIPDHP